MSYRSKWTSRRHISVIAFTTVVWFVTAASSTAQDVSGYFDYDPATGSLTFDNLQPEAPVNSFELFSTLGVYTGERPTPQSVFDTYQKHKFFTLSPKGLPTYDFGPLMAPGIDPAVLANDLCVTGSRLPRGPLEDIELRVGDQTWPIASPGVSRCPSVPHVERRTIEQIDLFLDYDVETGNLSLDSTNQPLGSIVLRLDRNPGPAAFIGEHPDLIENEVDFQETLTFRPEVLSYVKITGVEVADFGPVIEPGIAPEDLADQLCHRTRNIEANEAGTLFVRSGGATHEVSCKLLKKNPTQQVSAENLNKIVDQTVDLGIVIDAEEGTLVVHVPEQPDGASQPLTRLEISSTEPIFVPGTSAEGTLDGILDALTPTRLIKSDSNGFGTVDFGPILLGGMTPEEFESTVDVTGVFASGSGINSIQFVGLHTVPEPTAALLLLLSLPAVAIARRRTT